MSKTGDYIQEFLDDVGYQLGYNNNDLPKLKDIERIWMEKIHIWEYYGMSEIEYYVIDKNEGKTMP